MRIITHDVVIGHPKENARKMSNGCQNTAALAVAFVLKVQCQSKWCKASLTPASPIFLIRLHLKQCLQISFLFLVFFIQLCFIYSVIMPYSGFSLTKCRSMAKKLANSIS